MSLSEIVRSAMAQITPIVETEDGALVTTTCMYPSNGLVQVVVRGGETRFRVSDDGGAIRELLSAAGDVDNHDAALRRAIAARGLIVHGGAISSPEVPREALSIAIALVANASQEAAQWLFTHTKIRQSRDFRKVVRDFLRKRFVDQELKEVTVVGGSNKPHKFDSVVLLPGGRRLLVDAVVHDANAINSAVVSHLDVRARQDPSIEQRIVYDDDDEWPAPDLSLLSVGATAVPFSKLGGVLGRISGAMA